MPEPNTPLTTDQLEQLMREFLSRIPSTECYQPDGSFNRFRWMGAFTDFLIEEGVSASLAKAVSFCLEWSNDVASALDLDEN